MSNDYQKLTIDEGTRIDFWKHTTIVAEQYVRYEYITVLCWVCKRSAGEDLDTLQYFSHGPNWIREFWIIRGVREELWIDKPIIGNNHSKNIGRKNILVYRHLVTRII